MRSNTTTDSKPIYVALEDTIVLFVLALIAQLLVYGYPPDPEALYTSLLTGAMAGITAYSRARGVKDALADVRNDDA